MPVRRVLQYREPRSSQISCVDQMPKKGLKRKAASRPGLTEELTAPEHSGVRVSRAAFARAGGPTHVLATPKPCCITSFSIHILVQVRPRGKRRPTDAEDDQDATQVSQSTSTACKGC